MPGSCDRIASLGAFEMIVLGSGGPRSAGRAGSGYVFVVDGQARVMVDAGPGTFLRLGQLGLDASQLDTFLFTHLHIDHVGDFADLVKSRNLSGHEPVQLRVAGPPGSGPYPATTVFVDRLFGKQGAYAYLPEFRNELRFDVSDLSAGGDAPFPVATPTGLEIKAIAVDHGDTPALAYRLQKGGRGVVISGDLASRDDRLVRLAKDADLLVYDAAVLDPPGSPETLYRLHTPPARIGEVAAASGVARVLLSHVPPKLEDVKDEVRASVARGFDREILFAADCQRFDLSDSKQGK